jgi:hypothetical protein
MPDTGAPWNIPYVENADLVSDWPADSLLVANAVAAGLSAAQNAGIGSNVVQTVKTDTFSTASATFTAVTGLSATITPTTASSKILVILHVFMTNQDSSAASGAMMRLMRGASPIYVGDLAGSREQATVASVLSTRESDSTATAVFLDSPASAAATTYSAEARRGIRGTFLLNQQNIDSDNANVARLASSLTLIEVAV